MKAASLKQIKEELEILPPQEVLKLCMRIIKFKKENKELATYKLFYQTDEGGYATDVQAVITDLFADVNTTSYFHAKKTLRKIIRTANRYIKYSDDDTTAVGLLLHVCQSMKALPLSMSKNVQLKNMYNAQVKKVQTLVAGMHEDLQFEYAEQISSL